MKKYLFLLCFALSSLFVSAQTGKVVVNSKGEVLGRYVKTNAKTYTVCEQDDYDVPKAGNHIETWSAAKGQGIVYRSGSINGTINVRKAPNASSPVIAKIVDPEGVPDTYPCLGKVDSWYKIRINGKIGYLRADLAEWDTIDTF
ncbi:MAG: SH3 domain-containing protein [Prevotella sp.]|nr:SH3 domain-containing protein [Prevotella sp.]